jgi:hypothetical protein
MFDPSPEACLARKYEAAAERGFFRALKELRQLEEPARAAEPPVDKETFEKTLASFFPNARQQDAEFDAMYPEPSPMPPSKGSSRFESATPPPIGGRVDVPFAIGRRC